MRPENFLLHQSDPECLNLLLCDFGGAQCDDLGLDGEHLPDGPFYDPTQAECSRSVDIFSLGSLFCTILTELWSYRSCGGPFTSVEEMVDYDVKVSHLFRDGKYPNVADLVRGNVIMGCWSKQYQRAEDVPEALGHENVTNGDDMLDLV